MAKSYEEAGVNLEAGYEGVRRIKKHVASTARTGVMGNIGAFGGMFDLSKLGVAEPVLVSGTDGVGTKLKIAIEMDRHDTIGIDAVAMCVNDVLAQGAEPIFFLDYIALGINDPVKVEAIVSGVADGCRQAGCALVGGETAEMPGMYSEGEYDIAGFTVGIVDRPKAIDGSTIKAGDAVIGLASSGIHSNGFSLVRRLLLEQKGYSLTDKPAELEGRTLGDALIEPTRIYVKQILKLLESVSIKGMAHITGGGFIENIPRMLPEGVDVDINRGSWPVLPVFGLLQQAGSISDRDMYTTFNMGIGMVLVVPEAQAAQALEIAKAVGEQAYRIGTVTEGSKVVTFEGAELP